MKGFAVARAYILNHHTPTVEHSRITSEEEAERELSAFQEAGRRVMKEIREEMAKSPSPDALAILESQLFMIDDPDFRGRVEGYIREGHRRAAWAVESAAGEIVEALSRLRSDSFRERISDIEDVSSRLIASITRSGHGGPVIQDSSVLIADYLLPSEFLSLNLSLVKAIVLEKGGLTSHVAILSRAEGVPCLTSASSATRLVRKGSLVAFDGDEGAIYIDPDDEVLERIRAGLNGSADTDTSLPAITLDGVEIAVEANIEDARSIEAVKRSGASGIGLFRTEFLLMGGHGSDQVYSQVAEKMKECGDVCFRTYDIGGDKMVDGISENEENPVLGYRAVRLCMDRKDIFRPQLKAILKASVFGNVRIMFPMISGAGELDEVLSLFEDVKRECRSEGIAFDENIKVGIMIEVPSAAITADILARKVDFFSVGTNDLVQYTLAVDRGNEKIAHLYNRLHPAVLRLLKMTADAADEAGIELGICGEMAGDEMVTPLLVGLGYRNLSMNISSMARVKRLIRNISLADAQALAKRALNMTSYREISNLMEYFHAEIGFDK